MESVIIVVAWVSSALEPDLGIHGRVIAHAAQDHLPLPVGVLLLTTIMAIVLPTVVSYLLEPASFLPSHQRMLKGKSSYLRASGARGWVSV